MASKDKSYTKELIIYGRVKRFSQNPTGQALILLDGKILWTLDILLQDFEGKDICVSVKLGKPKKIKRRKAT